MGQKTNPKGFRLISTENHLSNWYSHKFLYPSLIEEDFFIRSKIETDFQDFLSLSKIEITRVNQDVEKKEYVTITLSALYPRAKEMLKKVTTYFAENTDSKISLPTSKGSLKRFTALLLKQNIRNTVRFLQIKTGKSYYIGIKFIKNPFQDAVLIAKFMADQLEQRVQFRRLAKKVIKKVKLAGVEGVKIQVSGRLNGNEIARTEWKRDGKVPLHTLRQRIDYTHFPAQTSSGILGLKVWLLMK